MLMSMTYKQIIKIGEVEMQKGSMGPEMITDLVTNVLIQFKVAGFLSAEQHSVTATDETLCIYCI